MVGGGGIWNQLFFLSLKEKLDNSVTQPQKRKATCDSSKNF